ncbi:uncharacterized protein NECHADRAFT_82192 [Fusarium vanettenii 77-13-4]|uniref:Uncharacterized protein n=1 Tax=Fusarium vanettenii (strain ATCC MYA-4622 / CBS 123669 / FGSC 9596 / NRRL 45880 / 77-13-4) TaxID=660122 RepID=C7ZJQ0_FUSV7|nr:uncharacterized protein NECHADRAFT_82192 [Fusarium vanettenii 77-13-4]EEU35778.1 hypothetical protein NECHADRAFT_82192 [Fusarium vanettenii 77-13-4]
MAAQLSNKGYWLSSFSEPGKIIDLPVPKASSGSVVVEVLATLVLPYLTQIHQGGVQQANLMLPLVPNANCIGRIIEVGPDATLLKPDDLVWADSTIISRDDSTVVIVQGHLGGLGERGRTLMQGEWRDGSFQQYQKVPLESCHLLNTNRLIKDLGYNLLELTTIILYTVAGGAMLEIANLQVGQTVVIGPATGSFSGAAVELALVCGANVVAIGRTKETLAELKEKLGNPERLKYAVMTGDVDSDAAAILRLTPDGKGADVFNDWTPGWIEKPLFLQAGLKTLKAWGKVVLSGAAWGSADIPYAESIHNNWQVIARWCCTRATLTRVLDLINQGQLKIGKSTGGEFTTFEQVEDVERAKEHASKNGRFKQYTVLLPSGPI